MNKDFDLVNRCYIRGQGAPIILLHGMGGPKIWIKIAEILSENFKIIIPIFPGYLDEDGIISYSDNYYVEFLEDVRKKFELNKFNIVGVSMGGRTTLNYSIKYPDKIASLTLIDTIGVDNMSPLFAMPIVDKVFSFVLKRLLSKPKNMIKLGVNDFVNIDSDIYKDSSKFFIDMMKSKNIRTNFVNILAKVALKHKDWEHCLNKLSIPTMILWASDDKTAPVEWAYRLNESIKNSKLHILENYRHMAIMEKPEFFTDKIFKFTSSK